MGGHRVLGLLLACSAAVWAQSFNFRPGVAYPAGNGPTAAAQGDFNGDGKLDIAVGNEASSTISIYLGNGDGSFTPGMVVPVPGCLVGYLAAGDFNHDGHIDLLTVCQIQSSVAVLPGSGDGKFGAPISTTLPNAIAIYGVLAGFFQTCAVADFNNDGVPDLVIEVSPSLTTLDSGTLSVILLLSNGDGTFRAPLSIVSGQSRRLPNIVLAGDFNHDGNQDLAVVIEVASPDTPELEILLGNGKGGFQVGATYSAASGILMIGGSVADLNKDNIPDIVLWGGYSVSSSTTSLIFAYLGAGDGTFKLAGNAPNTLSQGAVGMAAANLRGTGVVDLVEAVGVGSGKLSSFALQVSAGNGDGTFQAPVPIAFPSGLEPWPLSALAGDWNGDGLTDLAFPAFPSDFQLSLNNNGANSLQDIISNFQSLPGGNLVTILNGLTPAPALAVSKTQLQFAYVAGGATPPAQTVAISNSGTGRLNWTATSNSPWLAVSAASGTGAATLSISVSPGGLAPATYTGTVQISASGAASSPQSITVALTVSPSSTAPVITGVVNGASFQPGFESGSWVTIQGANLSNTNPGRIWKSTEIVDGNLPTQLDGTSVTIDGKSAYVYYISPNQLNVQAPTDSATGTVPVVVTNNSQVSAAFNAQISTYSPAFFLYTGTSYAIASHYPDYAYVGNPNAIAGTIAAHPGDVLILWGTGFGPTSPATPAGAVVTGAPAVAVQPTITVGGVQVSVINALLAPGSAGLYQIAITVPGGVSGAVAIQASMNGVTSQTGILLYVSSQ